MKDAIATCHARVAATSRLAVIRRTRAEYRLLPEQAGFEFEAVTATPAPVSVITARA